MNYEQSTGKSIGKAFIEYNEEHPEVYDLFKKYVQIVIDSKRSRGIKSKDIRTSSKLILNRIRWEVSTVGIPVRNSEENALNQVFDRFKINDAFTSRYARLFTDQNPEWESIFNQRKLRS